MAGVRGLRAVLEGVRAQLTLTALDVSDNVLSDEGAEAVSKGIISCPQLQAMGS